MAQAILGTGYEFGHSVANALDKEEWCVLGELPREQEDIDAMYEKMLAYEESYPEVPEEIGPVERVGLKIAKDIQEQSERYGRKKN